MSSGEAFGSEDRETLDRCLEFVTAAERRASESVEVADGISVLLSRSIPDVWDANMLIIERPEITSTEIIEACDRFIGGAGMDHRTAFMHDRDLGRRLAPEFEARGWTAEPGVFMALRRDPDRESEIEVFETTIDQVEDLQRSMIGGDATARDGGSLPLADQLLEWDRRIGKAVEEDRWYLAMADGKPAACCRLLRAGGIGQVESVGVIEEARGRGLGWAVSQAAATASKRAGDELTFITTLANDWPRLFYDRMGFEAIGEDWAFRVQPALPATEQTVI